MPATLKSRLPDIAVELRPKVSAAVKEGAQDIAKMARARVPVGEPDVHIRETIDVERFGPAAYRVVVGDRNTFYAAMVEFGTVYAAPQPYLVPAAEAGRADVAARVTTALRRL